MRRRLAGDERGTSLVELAVVVALLSTALAGILPVLNSTQTGVGRAVARSEVRDEARLALAEIDRQIRSGNVFYDPALDNDPANDVVPGMALRVYTQADAPSYTPGSQCAQWQITGDVLRTRRWASSDPSGTVTPWRTVASDIANREQSPPVPAFSLDSSASYGNRLMKIRIVVDRTDENDGPATFDLSVTGRNTQYGYPTQLCATIPAY